MNSFVSPFRSPAAIASDLDLICFSHLRWDFVTQRPQHLLSRAAKQRRVFYWEEPFRHGAAGLPPQANLLSRAELGFQEDEPRFALEAMQEGSVTVLRPHLCSTLTAAEATAAQAQMLQAFLRHARVTNYITWYYTPMAMSFTGALKPAATVYDCMDELSMFHGAPPELRQCEHDLLQAADVVFTGGISLYEAKRHAHPNVHAFPSSIDVAHFAAARSQTLPEPADQASIPYPRAGFCGVLDERLNVDLLREVAAMLPEVQFVLIGPVVKIDPATLPQGKNLHYLHGKRYEELPSYMAGWNVALLPFAKNDATRFISPTKTPEYLAAGRRVVSTGIRDVVRGYGDEGLVSIADTAEEFAAAIESSLEPESKIWWRKVDRKLAQTSWDQTWQAMAAEIAAVLTKDAQPSQTISQWKPVDRQSVSRLLQQSGARNNTPTVTPQPNA